MSIFEYNEEVELKKIREDEYSLGLEDGERKGRIEGGIESLVITGREFGLTREEITAKAMQRYSLTMEEVQGLVNRFWVW